MTIRGPDFFDISIVKNIPLITPEEAKSSIFFPQMSFQSDMIRKESFQASDACRAIYDNMKADGKGIRIYGSDGI